MISPFIDELTPKSSITEETIKLNFLSLKLIKICWPVGLSLPNSLFPSSLLITILFGSSIRLPVLILSCFRLNILKKSGSTKRIFVFIFVLSNKTLPLHGNNLVIFVISGRVSFNCGPRLIRVKASFCLSEHRITL